MGVSSFFRWLVDRYPSVVVDASEEKGECVDTTSPNPNGMEFDNLYLDMNGIIHPCFHPEDQLFLPSTSDEIFIAIFGYIDRIFSIVRPRKLIYMAIDGVAPRAKMNQQRARRYRSAKDAEIAEAEEERLRKEFERQGKDVFPREESEVLDPNIISPGTVFMLKLSKALEYYVRLRLNNDPGWQKLKVVLSDANVPGEGEHKIMSFIRLQRTCPGYDPNTRHCLYGLDADLIMLALATHEIHFSILREDVLPRPGQQLRSSFNKLLTRESDNQKSSLCCRKISEEQEGHFVAKEPFQVWKRTPYQFLNIWTLREYLELDMRICNPPFEVDIEKIIDDFVFICFFTGNDFLPHIPSISIREGGMDLLIDIYKKIFNQMGGYIVDTSKMGDKKMGYIKMKRVKRFMHEMGLYEEKIFAKRNRLWEKYLQKFLNENFEEIKVDVPDSDELQGFTRPEILKDENIPRSGRDEIIRNTIELKQHVKDFLAAKQDLFKSGALQNCKTKMGYPGYKATYYQQNFPTKSLNEMHSVQKDVVVKYMEGLCWILQYYYAGVCSWTWYYPYHYAPFASDLAEPPLLKIAFKLGQPFSPFDQLMAVLPPKSSHALPRAYRELMQEYNSPIANFYPTDIMVDTGCVRYLWQGIVKLPFIEEDLLLSATKKLENDLEDDEKQRNSSCDHIIFARSSQSSLGCQIRLMNNLLASSRLQMKHQIDSTSCEISGFLCKRDDNSLGSHAHFVSPVMGMEDISEDHSISAFFLNPTWHDHMPRLLAGVNIPEKKIRRGDIVERMMWHDCQGPRPLIRQGRQHELPEVTDGAEAGPGHGGRRGHGMETWKGAGSGWRGSGHTGASCLSHDSSATNLNEGRTLVINRGSDRRPTFHGSLDHDRLGKGSSSSSVSRNRARAVEGSSSGRYFFDNKSSSNSNSNAWNPGLVGRFKVNDRGGGW